jgi:hypothetical protein
MENCKQCHEIITGNFCSNCGQKKYKRIDKKYIWDEVQYTLLHTNKGFLYSIKNILKNPGKTAREYIDGNRVNHYKPILLVFVLSGLATFTSYKILNLNEVTKTYFEQQHINSTYTSEMMSFMSSYNSLLMLLLVPLFALTTKIAFRKSGNNYYEHVVMNAYILSYYTVVSIFFIYPIMFFFRHSPDTFFTISQLSIFLMPFILVWFFREFYKDKPLKSIILNVLGVMVLTLLGFLAFIIAVGIFAVLTGPVALQSIKPE